MIIRVNINVFTFYYFKVTNAISMMNTELYKTTGVSETKISTVILETKIAQTKSSGTKVDDIKWKPLFSYNYN